MSAEKTTEDLLIELVKELAQNSHSVAKLSDVRSLLNGKFSSMSERLSFLSPYLLRDCIMWDDVKTEVWATEDIQKKNKYHCLQGDIIETTLAKGIGYRLADDEAITTWLVVSPDCDCVRANYVRLAPVFFVKKDTENYGTHKSNMSSAARLSSPKYFPLGIDIFEDGSEGCYADFTEPYFIKNEDKESVTVHYSLQSTGWHLLNAIIKESETRADINEGEKIRNFYPQAPVEPQ